MVCDDVGLGFDPLDHLRRHPGLAHAHVVPPEEELTVQVGGLDRVQVDL